MTLRVFLGSFACCVSALFVAGSLAGPQSPSPKDRSAMWKQVDDAIMQGLPKTAVEQLEAIHQAALNDKAYPEAAKAIAYKIVLEGNVQGSGAAERIKQMRAVIDKSPAETKPLLYALQGSWYWSYFNENRWQFSNRTATTTSPGDDFTTWDLKRLFAEIDQQYSRALEDEATLKATPIANLDTILEKGTVPDSYRPTAFDFLAHHALEFYAAGEQAGSLRQNAFEFDASSPALGTLDEFLAWDPQTKDEQSTKLRAIRLFQNLLRFHRNDADLGAFLDAELLRLQFAYNMAVGENKAERYESALKRFAEEHSKHELSSLARARWAQLLVQELNYAEALEIAQQGANAFPESPGGIECQNLIGDIKRPSASLQTERIWSDPLPVIRVTYRNIARLHFRMVRVDWMNRFTRDRWHPSQFNDADRKELAERPRVAEWTVELPVTEDFRPATHDVPAPTGLPAGYYIVLASLRPDFSEEDNQVFACEAWVSKLALVIRQSWSRPIPLSGFVLDNRTGHPIAGAKIKTVGRDPQNQRMVEGPSTISDADGRFQLPPVQTGSFLVASHNDEVIATIQEYASQSYSEQARAMSHVHLFTDRSLYRPGQMIHFKGVAMLVDQQENRYELMKNRNFRVKLLDINQQQVAMLEVKSNDFGSFSGSFTAPRDRGNGGMAIVVEEMNFAYAAIQVEEYKRPKFQVDIDMPKEPSRLGDVVKVSGKAMSYTGAPIQGAAVRYRVVRQVRWPDWFMFYYGWRIAPYNSQPQEIASGWTETKDDGSFECQFAAQPDRSVAESDDPIFTYSVMVDVTDGTGETRSDQASVSVGYKAMQLELRADDWQSKDHAVQVRVRTTTLDGEALRGQGKLRIYSLREPESVQRPDILGQRLPRPVSTNRNRAGRGRGIVRASLPAAEPDPADWKNWPLGDEVAVLDIDTEEKGTVILSVELKRGLYRCVAESQDRYGKPVKAELNLRVLDDTAKQLGLKVPFVFAEPRAQVEPGETWKGLWGSGYEGARAYVEIEHRGKTLQKYWTPVGVNQLMIEQPIEEVHRGGLTIHVTMVRENRLYTETHVIDVPWSQKQLQVRWDRFRSKLTPGSEETWSLTITDPKGAGAIAEMVAALYDQSLDAYLPHNWLHRFSMFYQESPSLNSTFQNVANGFQWVRGSLKSDQRPVSRSYRHFPVLLQAIGRGDMYLTGMYGDVSGRFAIGATVSSDLGVEGRVMFESDAKSAALPGAPMAAMAEPLADSAGLLPGAGGGGVPPNAAGPKLDSVSPRKNLNETAFFFPHLISDSSGKVTIQFTMPDALTQWRFMSFAHDEQMRSGSLFDSVVTAKDLMVQPNPPRFLREGDELEFSVKLTNQSPTAQAGTVALHLSDAIDLRNLDEAYANVTAERPFELAPNSSKSVRWKIRVPDGARPIIFKAVAATDKLSDGEEGMLPVLSNRILVTESLPLPIRGPAEKEFEFKKLLESGQSKTLRHQSLTVQMTSQPAWYAVLALPYLMEYPHECSEQIFNRLYANALAKHVATSDPKIERVFAVWRQLQPEALQSPLSKNEDLKSVLIEETPWLRNAENETQARKNVGLLFERNRLDTELQRAMTKLAQMQRGDGMWPWFPGGPDNEYLSLYIVTGFGRLRHMGVGVDESLAIRALDRLDAWMQESFERIPTKERIAARNHLSPTIAMYLYGRSFYLVDRPIAKPYQTALRFWQEQARAHWLKLSRQSQAHIAVGMKRMGDRELPDAILKSLMENSVYDEEMGRSWRDDEASWWWYHAPIETQAMMIEALDEVAGNQAAVEECKVWLLKQKQTQDWRTTKATADAVYALLARGGNWLASDTLVKVQVADMVVEPEKVEAGTGFYERTYSAAEIRPDMGSVRLTKSDEGVSWGSIHWQYLEDIRNITSHVATPLKLEKKIYRRQLTESGPVLEEVVGPVSVGDELVCRIVLKTDRDMEYVHLKDYRGSGTEPVNVLSGYRFQDGLVYYENTRDTATHFFIDYLRRGNYVFEYTLRVQHAGDYPMGMATLQCMYAPEFNSHSESIQLQVK